MLQKEGMFVVGNTSGSFFYVLAGTHAIHLSIGILVLLYALSSEVFSWKLETRCLVVDVTSWYWHFMAAFWISVFPLPALFRCFFLNPNKHNAKIFFLRTTFSLPTLPPLTT